MCKCTHCKNEQYVMSLVQSNEELCKGITYRQVMNNIILKGLS